MELDIFYRWITQIYAIGIVAGLATKAIKPILKTNVAWLLPMDAWYPYDINNIVSYLLSYIQQLIGGIPSICLHISFDSFFVGIVLQMCIQLKLLKHRLQTLAYSSNANTQHDKTSELNVEESDTILANCAYKHDCILRYIVVLLMLIMNNNLFKFLIILYQHMQIWKRSRC